MHRQEEQQHPTADRLPAACRTHDRFHGALAPAASQLRSGARLAAVQQPAAEREQGMEQQQADQHQFRGVQPGPAVQPGGQAFEAGRVHQGQRGPPQVQQQEQHQAQTAAGDQGAVEQRLHPGIGLNRSRGFACPEGRLGRHHQRFLLHCQPLLRADRLIAAIITAPAGSGSPLSRLPPGPAAVGL